MNSTDEPIKLYPIGTIRKEEKREFRRYAVKSYADDGAARSYITFDVYLKQTDARIEGDGALPTEIGDLTVESPNAWMPTRLFSEQETVDKFRGLMLAHHPSERLVGVTRILPVSRDANSLFGGRRRSMQRGRRLVRTTSDPTVAFLGEVHVLGLDRASAIRSF